MICEWILEGSVLWVVTDTKKGFIVTDTKKGFLILLEICGHIDLDKDIWFFGDRWS